ncbi:SRPBCC family protein (plasmid) [Natrialbaceae archaeon A-arb3/5]
MSYQPRVVVSRVIPGSVDDVWEEIRDFGSFDEWHPAIENCTIDDGKAGDQTGAVRDFDAPGKTVREELVAHSDTEHSYQYTILAGAGNKTNYLSELRLVPITESDQTLAVWEGYFDVDDGDLEGAKENLTKVFSGGLDGLHEQFS